MFRKAVYCRFHFSFSLPIGMEWQTWVQTASAWKGYSGELDAHGRLVHRFGPHESGKLTIRYDPATGRGSVWGSLQSFRYGHNSGPFPFAEVLSTGEALAAALLLPAEAFRVHGLETGVTVPTNEAPTAFLAQIAHANYGPTQRPFYAKEPPANTAHPLQYTAGFEQYRVKVYDKGTYNRLLQKPLPPGPTGNGFRFELHYKKSTKAAAALGWNGSLTFANLLQPEVFARLATVLLESWQQIHLPPTMDLQGLNIDERALLIAGSNPDFWQYAKQDTPTATYKRKRALFHRLQKQQETPETATPHTAEFEQELAAALPPGYQV